MQKIQVMDINLGIIYVQQKERVSKATQGGKREEQEREGTKAKQESMVRSFSIPVGKSG